MPLEFEQPEEQQPSLLPPQNPQQEEGTVVALKATSDRELKRMRRFSRWLPHDLRELVEPYLYCTVPTTPPARLRPIYVALRRNVFFTSRSQKEVALWYLRHAKLKAQQKRDMAYLVETMFEARWVKGAIRRIVMVYAISASLVLLMATTNSIDSLPWLKNAISAFDALMQWCHLIDHTGEEFGSIYLLLVIVLYIPLFLFFPVVLPWLAYDSRQASRIHGLALDTLGALGEVSGIPTLAEYASKGNFPLNQRAREALLSLLPLLTSEQLGTFPSRTVVDLCKSLPRGDTETQLALLRALELIGDARAIPALTQLVQRSEESQVRDLAQRLITILEVRESELNLKQNLLRASQSPKESSEELLRPVVGEVETAPQELLRPVDQ